MNTLESRTGDVQNKVSAGRTDVCVCVSQEFGGTLIEEDGYIKHMVSMVSRCLMPFHRAVPRH